MIYLVHKRNHTKEGIIKEYEKKHKYMIILTDLSLWLQKIDVWTIRDFDE